MKYKVVDIFEQQDVIAEIVVIVFHFFSNIRSYLFYLCSNMLELEVG
jgi:hypothetical protein